MQRVHTSYIRIDKSGINGHPGEAGCDGNSGASGGHSGREGQKGKRGGCGTSAEPIKITLGLDTTGNHVTVWDATTSETHSMPINTAKSIELIAEGGDGGKGGRGGHGGDGGRGANGVDATQFSSASSGGRGGEGGHGGQGGEGGHGGCGGDITVNVASQYTDLLMLLHPIGNCAGQGGAGGAGGEGGLGGAGGMGGNSYSWTETVSVPTVDEHGHHHHKQVHENHYQPGGYSGSRGHDGSRGIRGNNGSAGDKGRFQITVSDYQVSYPGRYDIEIQSLSEVTSPDRVIEPEEILYLSGLTFKNTGYMPTPDQPIVVSLVNSDWLTTQPSEIAYLPSRVLPGQSAAVKPLAFRVSPPAHLPVVDDIFSVKTQLKFSAIMTRVNKAFPEVARAEHPMTIRYPVELSIVSGARSIAPHEEAPLAIAIRNLSSQPVGHDAGREVTVSLRIEGIEPHHLTFTPRISSVGQDFTNGHLMNVIYLGPGEVQYFSGTIKFTSPLTPGYTQIRLLYDLHIGSVTGLTPGLKNIQRNTFNLQLAESYRHHPHADVVLITNDKTSLATIDYWRSLAARVGKELDIWNVSLYSGLSYFKPRCDGQSFASQLKDKVVIILNDQDVIRYLDQMEIFHAVRTASIATYVIGPHFNLKEALYPVEQGSVLPLQTIDELINKSASERMRLTVSLPAYHYFYMSSPSYEYLSDQASEQLSVLNQRHPNEQYLAVCHYAPKVVSKNFFKAHWSLGTIELRPCLGKKRSYVACRSTSAVTDPHDFAVMLKLLPLETKLGYVAHVLAQTQESSQRVSLLEDLKVSIMSDLLDELRLFGEVAYTYGRDKEKLFSELTALHQLNQYDFRDMLNIKGGMTFLHDFLLHYEYLAHRLSTTTDNWWFSSNRCRPMLEKIVTEKVHNLLVFYCNGLNHDQVRKQFAERYAQSSREVLYAHYSPSRFGDNILFDAQIKQPQTIDAKKMPTYTPKPSTFTEGLHFFATSEARDEAIDYHEKHAVFKPGRQG